MNDLFKTGLKAADHVRAKLNINMFDSLNIYEVCENLDVSVRITDINMEGMYKKSEDNSRSIIFLSNQRPISRQIFTCAHELGHHYFNHGSKIDSIDSYKKYSTLQLDEESLVNVFAANLLMPMAGIQSNFLTLKTSPQRALPIHFYIMSSYYGVGFTTIVNQCRFQNIITRSKYTSLMKLTPKLIFKNSISKSLKNSHFKIIQIASSDFNIELEVTNYLIIQLKIENSLFSYKETCSFGYIYQMNSAGYTSLNFHDKIITVRVRKKLFFGLAKYRYLQN